MVIADHRQLSVAVSCYWHVRHYTLLHPTCGFLIDMLHTWHGWISWSWSREGLLGGLALWRGCGPTIWGSPFVWRRKVSSSSVAYSPIAIFPNMLISCRSSSVTGLLPNSSIWPSSNSSLKMSAGDRVWILPLDPVYLAIIKTRYS